jgi:hypothetical protein
MKAAMMNETNVTLLIEISQRGRPRHPVFQDSHACAGGKCSGVADSSLKLPAALERQIFPGVRLGRFAGG